VQPPPTRYADAGGVQIAYQLLGERELVVVGVTNWATNVEGLWQVDAWVDLAELLSRSVRMVMYDQRGTGLSDRVPLTFDLAEAVADLLAVIDDLNAERVALIAPDVAAPVALAFAAEHPDRVERMVMWGPTVRLLADTDYDVGLPRELAPFLIENIVEGWGVADSAFNFVGVPPTYPGHEQDREHIARVQRQATSRRDLAVLAEQMVTRDAREYVARVPHPTLVQHRANDRLVPVEQGQWLADHLPNGRFSKLPGDGHYAWLTDRERLVQEMLEFLLDDAGAFAASGELAAIVVTDIVGSTTHAATFGRERWRAALDRHDTALRRLLRLRGGHERNTAGDSFVATFSSAADACEFTLAACAEAERLGLTLRAGVHVADVEERDGQLHGLGVHVATRIQTAAEAGQVLVSAGVRDAVLGASRLGCTPAGMHALRNVPGEWPLYALARC
jgi:pimeloyl-ACP methyl ester carboxylesterase